MISEHNTPQLYSYLMYVFLLPVGLFILLIFSFSVFLSQNISSDHKEITVITLYIYLHVDTSLLYQKIKIKHFFKNFKTHKMYTHTNG